MSTREVVLCAAWTKATEADPCGTAGHYDTIVAIETPGPWPADIGEIPGLEHGFGPTVRVVVVVPSASEAEPAGRVITVWQRENSGHMKGNDYTVAADTAVAEAIEAIIDREDVPGLLRTEPAGPEILICGHGRRDRCCGSHGVRLAIEVADRYGPVRVRRCSHLGGHRFAPTAITLPDGRWWAYLDVPTLDKIVERRVDSDLLAAHYRGNGAMRAEAQLLERHLFADQGEDWYDSEITKVTTQPVETNHGLSEQGDRAQVTIAWNGLRESGRSTGRVRVARTIPVVECGSDVVVHKKSSVELALEDIQTTGFPSLLERTRLHAQARSVERLVTPDKPTPPRPGFGVSEGQA